MEAGSLLRPIIPLKPKQPLIRSLIPSFPRVVRVSCNLQGGYRGLKPRREWVADWVSRNDDAVRSLPIYVGGVSLLAVLFNRAVSGIAPVADAGSSQSRADLLTLGLAVTNILAGLVWLSIRPKTISVVNPQGVECRRINSQLPDFAVSELLWVWESLLAATCCRSLVIVYDCKFILQTGFAAASSTNDREAVPVDVNALMQESYLANLALYPGKSQLPFLPSNTQAVIFQPLGDKGIAIVGGDTIRGFTNSDQGWISLIGEKLDATLAKYVNKHSVVVEDMGRNKSTPDLLSA